MSRAESILCGECFDGGEFKSVGISVARCFCCGAMCGAIFASEKRQAYHVNGDRSRVRPERRHLFELIEFSEVEPK